MLYSFAAYLADQGLSPQTIKSYLPGVRNIQLSLGFPNPRDQASLPILKRVQAGIKRDRLGTTPASVRLPVTPPLLRQLRQYLDATAHKERVAMWAICCMAFFGCFRLGELLLESPNSFDQQYHLTWIHVAVDSQTDPRMLHIDLKQSKTDQFHRGADIVVGRTGTNLCPVAAVLGPRTRRLFPRLTSASHCENLLYQGTEEGHLSTGPVPGTVCGPQLSNWGSYLRSHGRGSKTRPSSSWDDGATLRSCGTSAPHRSS